MMRCDMTTKIHSESDTENITVFAFMFLALNFSQSTTR